MYLPVNIHFQLIIITNVSIWSTNIRKLAKDHKGYGSATRYEPDMNIVIQLI